MQQNNKKRLLAKLEEFHARIYIILAIVLLATFALLCEFTKLRPIICGSIIIAVYAVSALIVFIIVNKKITSFRNEESAAEAQSQSVVYAFRNQVRLPYAIISDKGKIITANSAFENAVSATAPVYNTDISSYFEINIPELIELSSQKMAFVSVDDDLGFDEISLKDIKRAELALIGDRKFRMECYSLFTKGKSYMIFFHDITEFSALDVLHKNLHTAVGYIVIDNLEEIAQYVKINYQDETRTVGKLLGEWASKMGGVIREYESNKFLLLFTQQMLSECVKNKFAILSEIHKIEIGDAHIPLTVSMGIATTGATLEEREHDAMVSLDMALQRGGDQVVFKNPTGTFYFGASTKTQQKRTRGHGKIIYAKIAALIDSSSNVLIMAHKNPDFDAIGACIGVSVLIRNMFPGKDVKIVTDKNSNNFLISTARLSALSDYRDMFIDGVSAIEHNSSNTLLIIVDANNMAIVESPELAKSCFKKVIIDHHIKKEEFEDAPELAYIDPSASSACELISEMLEEILPPDISFKEEANIMLSGIMLDTHNFTRTVGMRTFASALYLKNSGADPEYARTFFEENFDDYLSESQFGSTAQIYRDRIAIATATDSGNANARILAAKASDKMLSVRGIDASFALILIGDTVSISARSNGSINVQLIAERLGGGGHFDMAGAALRECSLEDAEAKLKEAIDSYFASLADSKDTDSVEE